MPRLNTNIPRYRPQRELEAEWEQFSRGLNLLLRPTELGRDELSQADNIMLVGEGIPTGRWGTSRFFNPSTSGIIRGFGTYRDPKTAVSEIFTLTDEGYIYKKDNSSAQMITGQSYPSGSTIRTDQLGGYTYIASKNAPLARYNGVNIESFITLSAPTGLAVSNVSGVTGSDQYGWSVVTIGVNGGQTLPSDPVTISNAPARLPDTLYHLQWTAPSAAPSLIAGYEIYRGFPGDLRFLSFVGPSQTSYSDFGDPVSSIFEPLENSTGGLKTKFVKRFKDRLIMVSSENPSRLVISATFPNESKTTWASGGGILDIAPDDGFEITGIEPQPSSNTIIVFKEFASYAVKLGFVQIGNFNVLNPTYETVSNSVGCSNPDTIQTVENDVFYFGRKGLYVVGYEPNFLSIIRTNEISARIRPYLDRLNETDYENCAAFYVDNKYILSFPDRKEMVVYDRERGAFAGIWKLPFGVNHLRKYIDDSGTERWVIGSSEDSQVYTFEESIKSDDGVTITKTLRTNKEAFNSWSLLKIVKLFYILFRNVQGTVTVNILLEDRNGVTSTVKSFDITGSEFSSEGGWGSATWGTVGWGDNVEIQEVVAVGEEITRWSQLFKSMRLIQVEVQTNEANSDFELLGIRMTANSQGEGSLSSSQRT